MFDHLSVGVTSLERSGPVYEALLAPLGVVCCERVARARLYAPLGFVGEAPFAIIVSPEGALVDPRMHIAFAASSRGQVDAAYRAALAHGAADDGPPGIRAHYHPGYYAAFLKDPDGRRIEVVHHERLRDQDATP
jgi:catechol 2,3-dioxygenase-like lactoylglutathione lyase family enzyme